MKELCHKTDCLGISGIVFEEHKAVWATAQEFPGFLERSSVFQLDSDQAAIALEHIANQKKIFLAIAYQKY